jgi:hypothetical protein
LRIGAKNAGIIAILRHQRALASPAFSRPNPSRHLGNMPRLIPQFFSGTQPARIPEKSRKSLRPECNILLPNQQHKKGWMLAGFRPHPASLE